MLYVERSAEGKIIALHNSPRPGAEEFSSLMDEDVLEFFNSSDSWKSLMALTDMGTIRILEDLIDLLVSKQVIQFTELPEQAQHRIWERRQIREKIVAEGLIVEDIL
jgi:aminoglycoside phosphotransferase (APT) family kinase protein